MSLRAWRRIPGTAPGSTPMSPARGSSTLPPGRHPEAGGPLGQIAEGLLSLSGWAALACLFVFRARAAPAVLGLALPGEVTLVLGGVLASQDRIPLAAALAVGT